jgi:hypothetical protein
LDVDLSETENKGAGTPAMVIATSLRGVGSSELEALAVDAAN